MYFPKWVETPKTEQERASARLKFIILLLALHAGARPTLRSFGEKIDMNHTLLWKLINAGSFSRPAATKVIKATGTKLVTVDDLVYPLEIKATKTPA